MDLTAAQLSTLAAYIAGHSALGQLAHNLDGAYAAADILNAETDPPYIVWKTSLGPDEYRNCYAGSVFDNVPADRFNQWDHWTARGSISIDPSHENVREMIENTFQGAHASLGETRAALLAAAKRPATLLESIFAQAIGENPGTEANPATLTVEGRIDPQYLFGQLGW